MAAVLAVVVAPVEQDVEVDKQIRESERQCKEVDAVDRASHTRMG